MFEEEKIKEMVARSIERQELDAEPDEEMEKIRVDMMHYNSSRWTLGQESIPLEDPKTVYLCIGAMVWGKSFSKDEAIANCRKRSQSDTGKLFKVTPDTWVDGMGGIRWNIPFGVEEKDLFEPEELDDEVVLFLEDEHLNNFETEIQGILDDLRTFRRTGDKDYLRYVFEKIEEDVDYIMGQIDLEEEE